MKFDHINWKKSLVPGKLILGNECSKIKNEFKENKRDSE
jgi:hypothetical protein